MEFKRVHNIRTMTVTLHKPKKKKNARNLFLDARAENLQNKRNVLKHSPNSLTGISLPFAILHKFQVLSQIWPVWRVHDTWFLLNVDARAGVMF